jgi:hypothetical protein
LVLSFFHLNYIFFLLFWYDFKKIIFIYNAKIKMGGMIK